MRTVELEGQFLVPSQIALLTLLNLHKSVALNERRALVNHELDGLRVFFLLRRHVLSHQPPPFCTHGGAGILDTAKDDAHPVVAIRHPH